MRSLTTDWNNAAHASATEFTDKNGAVVSIPANEPTKVRSMQDSVIGGDYQVGALDSFVATPDTATKAALETQAVVVTLLDGAVPMAGIIVTAVSSDTSKGTVSPASIKTNASGEAAFTVTAVATGEATITFATKNGAFTDTHVLTVS